MIMLVLCICLSVFHVWDKTCRLCVSEPGLLHLTWCPPIISIYLQTTWHYSLWLSNIPLCIYITFFLSIHQLKGTWVDSKAWLLWILLQWTLVYRCFYHILSYVPLGRCPGVCHLIIWYFFLWLFEKSHTAFHSGKLFP
jgi:hypothetical protein